MSKKIYTYKEASSEKVYSVSFTVDGVVHHLEAQCYTDDESIMDLPATWDVTDRAHADIDLLLPNELITGARMGYLAVNHTPYTVRRADAVFVRKLDNYAKGIFGGGFLLTPRAAAERAAAERSAFLRLSLSARERELLKLATKIYEEA